MNILIIDADSIVYAAAFASQNYAVTDEEGNIYGVYSTKREANEAANETGDLVTVLPEPDFVAEQNADGMIENILEQFSVDEFKVFLTTPDVKKNFRYTVDEEYKANRKDFEKPHHYQTVRDRLTNKWDAVISREGWEADDEVSALGWEYWEHGDWSQPLIICSIDKDLDTVPGHHYRWQTYNKEADNYFVSDAEAMENYWISALTGDKADNIPGLYRIGPKRAGSILRSCETELEYYRTARTQYIVNMEKEGYTEEKAVERMHKNCKMLYLMRSQGDTGWEPPE